MSVINGNSTRIESRGWLSLGAEGFCYDVSDSFVEMLGVPVSRFLVRNWITLVYVEDRETVRQIANSLQREEVPAPVRMRWMCADDSVIWLEVRFLRRRDRRRRCGEDRIIANVRRIRPEAA